MTLDEITKEIEAKRLRPKLRIVPDWVDYSSCHKAEPTGFHSEIEVCGATIWISDLVGIELEAAEAALKWLKERGE